MHVIVHGFLVDSPARLLNEIMGKFFSIMIEYDLSDVHRR